MPGESNRVIAKRYEIISELGAGGTASVFLAHDETLNREVAIKLLNPDQVTAEGARRFQLEAKTASTLSHQNLINVLDFGITANNEIYLVMDYVKGCTLAQYVEKNGPIPIVVAAPLFMQICEGIGYAHKQGILHRDLKSTNVMLTDEDSDAPRVLILDFGLAKHTEDDSITRTGVLIGSPLYMSPEQASGQELDGRADIYSMGCLMYHTLTGIYPIQGDTILDTIMKQTSTSAPTLRHGRPSGEFSEELEGIIATCLKKDRSQRFSSMDELLEEIEALPETTYSVNSELFSAASPKGRESIGARHSRTSAFPNLFVAVMVIGAIAAVAVVSTLAFQKHQIEPVAPIKLESYSHEMKSNSWESMPWNDGIVWKKRFGIDDRDLADPRQMKGIEYLSLYSENITAEGLKSISQLPLKGIYLKETRYIHSGDLAILSRIGTLEALFLDNNEQFNDEGLQSLASLKSIRMFGLSDDNFTDKAIETIMNFPNLEILYLDGMQNLKGDNLHKLAKLKHLHKLCLDLNPQISPQNLESLGEIKSLKTLYLCDTRTNGTVLEKISRLPLLQELDVKRTNIRDKDVPLFQKFPSLKTLYISDNKISPSAFVPLSTQTKFKVIEKERMSVDLLNHIGRPR